MWLGGDGGEEEKGRRGLEEVVWERETKERQGGREEIRKNIRTGSPHDHKFVIRHNSGQ